MLAVKSRTGDVFYEERGSGTPLVLLHANPGDHRDFEAVIPSLAEHYRVIAVDWPGYGQSPAVQPPKAASAMLFADVLEDVIQVLKLKQAIFIGNSVGGYAASRLAITQPDRVRALVLVSPGGFSATNWFSRLFCAVKGREAITRLIATRFARFYLKQRNEWTAQILARTDAGRRNPATVAVDTAVWRSFARPEHDLRQRAAAITAPTLIVVGRYDPVIRAHADGRIAARSIPGAHLAIPDTGHEPFAEAPDDFLSIVLPFLEQIEQVESSHVPSHA